LEDFFEPLQLLYIPLDGFANHQPDIARRIHVIKVAGKRFQSQPVSRLFDQMHLMIPWSNSEPNYI